MCCEADDGRAVGVTKLILVFRVRADKRYGKGRRRRRPLPQPVTAARGAGRRLASEHESNRTPAYRRALERKRAVVKDGTMYYLLVDDQYRSWHHVIEHLFIIRAG